MPKSIKILITLAVIFFTALNIYRVELTVPLAENPNDPEDLLYKHYMLTHAVIVSVFVCGNMLVWLTGYTNRLIKTCIVANISVFAYIVFKIFFLKADEHYYFDWTILGVAFIYLLKPYSKDLLLLCKVTINQIYALCQRTKPKGK